MCSSPAVFTVQTATLTAPWCATRSGYDQRNYNTHSRKGVHALTLPTLQTLSYQSSLSTPLNSHQDSADQSAVEIWKYIRDSIYNTAMSTFGKRKKQNVDWFEANLEKMEPAIQAKHTSLINYKKHPTENTLYSLRSANCQMLCQQLLAKTLSEHSAVIRHRKHMRHV